MSGGYDPPRRPTWYRRDVDFGRAPTLPRLARDVSYAAYFAFAYPVERHMPTTTIDCLTTVFQQQFDDGELIVTRETSAADVEGWDSLTHVTLMLTIEKKFAIRFKSSQVASLKNVGELADLIDSLHK